MQAKLRKDLIIQSVAGETIVFDPMSAEAHYLNERATRVFRACQQKKEHQDTADVRYALSLFQEKGLLEDSDVLEQATRRQALQLMGKVALLPALNDRHVAHASRRDVGGRSNRG